MKIASRDLTNEPLIDAVAATGIPLILSTGMATLEDIRCALAIVEKHHNDLTILHCVSSYPTSFRDVNLRRMATLRKETGYPVGYSDHTQGIVAPCLAVALGAVAIEKHITLDRSAKGTDHLGSLERDGLYRMMRDIRHTEEAMGDGDIAPAASTRPARAKLERSLCASVHVRAGDVITEDMVHLRSPGTGYKWRHRDYVIGKTALVDIPKGEVIVEQDIYN